jgi:hypothetical protein
MPQLADEGERVVPARLELPLLDPQLAGVASPLWSPGGELLSRTIV